MNQITKAPATTKQLITFSRMSTNSICRRKHKFAYEDRIRKQTDAKALRIGSAGHEATDILAKTSDLEKAVEAIRHKYQYSPEGYDEYDWRIEEETIVRLVCGYHWMWGESAITYSASEHPFQFPLVNPDTGARSTNFDFAGVIDGIVSLEDSRLAVLERKFLGEDHGTDSDLQRRLRIDHQISLYVYAAREDGHPVETVLYDVIRKPSIKPTAVPVLDSRGLKIVLDLHGDRVMTNARKPRQTGNKDKGWTLQTRLMTVAEWGEKLNADIAERPNWYFNRIEVPRLDDEIDEACHELWQVQKTLREAQRTGRWFRTVNRNTCNFCSYFELCSTKFNPEISPLPEGFEYVDDIHPELQET